MTDRILRLPKVLELTGKCRSGIYSDIEKGNFPKSVPIGERAVGWLESDIERWLKERVGMRHAARGESEAA